MSEQNQVLQNGIPYPLDFDALKKGDTIEIATLEHITGEKAGTERYAFKCMNLCKEIAKEMEARESPATARIRKNSIEILLDKDSANYNNWVFDKGRRKMRHALTRQAKVDVANLSEEERRIHDYNLSRNANTYQGLMRARKEVPKLENYQQQLPGLPKPKEDTEG